VSLVNRRFKSAAGAPLKKSPSESTRLRRIPLTAAVRPVSRRSRSWFWLLAVALLLLLAWLVY